MIIEATQKNTRQTARKVRLVANAVRKKPLLEAMQQLAVMQRRASLVVMKVVRQAIANAQHNHGLSVDQLKLKNILVDPGQTYRRFQAVSRGRAHKILKRTCHVTVQLEVVEPSAAKATDKKAAKTAKKTTVAADKKAAPKKVASKKTAAKKTATKKTTKKTTAKSTNKEKK